MSQVIYARVPDTVKADVEEYADQQGVSLTSAVVDLVQRGLSAVSEEPSIANLEARVAALTSEKSAIEAQLTVASNEIGAMRSFAQRATTTQVGHCPECRSAISGLDLLGMGRCGVCGRSLVDLIAPTAPARQSVLDDRAVGVLVGALGIALVAAAVLGSKGALP